MLTDQVLNILKFVLLGLLYLFFARVLWAVWSEVRMPRHARSGQRIAAPAAQARIAPDAPTVDLSRGAQAAAREQGKRRAAKGRGGRAARLVVLEPRAKRGTTLPIQGELTIGRDAGCTLSIPDDTYASQLHARVYDHQGQPMIEDLGSTNGTFHNGNKLLGSRLLHPGDRLQIGTTVIEAQ